MSRITSSTYSVVTDSQDGDLFAIVRNGQLMKMNRAALQAFIETIAPDTFISLSDVPGSYVGQAGKALAVNFAEDALEFVTSDVAPSFLSMPDTPNSYGGQTGRIPAVNAGETALEFIDNAFIELSDTPASYTASRVLMTNVGGTAVEFVTRDSAAPTNNLTGGWFAIEHAGANQAYTGGSGFVTLENDGAGANSRSDYAPPGVTDVYDEVNDEFDFSELAIGDWLTLRIDLTVTTASANQSVSINLLFDNGGSPFTLTVFRGEFKTAAAHTIAPELTFFIGSDAIRNNPVELQLSSDGNATIDMSGYALFINRRGA